MDEIGITIIIVIGVLSGFIYKKKKAKQSSEQESEITKSEPEESKIEHSEETSEGSDDN